LMAGSRYSQCHDESMEEHVPPSPLHSGKKDQQRCWSFFISEKMPVRRQSFFLKVLWYISHFFVLPFHNFQVSI
jgi:hypothetical protein